MSTSPARSGAEDTDRATLPLLAAGLAATIAIAAIAGWALGIAALTSVVPGAVEMQPNTAFGLLACAVSLALLAGNAKPRRAAAAQALAVLIVLLGFATLSEHVFDVNLGIDAVVFGNSVGDGPSPGRMSPYTSAGLVCVGLALACLPWRAMRAFVWIVTVPVIITGVLSMFGYAWHADITAEFALAPLALGTAYAFVALGAGTLAASLQKHDEGARAEGPAERKVLMGCIAALLVILIAGVFTYRAGSDLARSAGELERSNALRQSVRHLYGSVAEVKGTQRGYLLTGDPGLRDAYARRAKEISDYQRTVERLARSEQQPVVAEVGALVARTLEELARQVAVYEREGGSAAKEAIVSAGPDSGQAIFEATERIVLAEEAWLVARESDAARSRLLTLLSLVITLVVATGALAVLFRGIRREMAARARSEHAVREAHRFCDSVIENIPDTVFVKDAHDLKYVRINRAAEELLARSRMDVIGHADGELHQREIAERFVSQDLETLALGAVVDIPQETFVTGAGDERILHTKKIPIPDSSGRPRYLLGISQDITERKEQEARVLALNAALAQRAAEVEAMNKELESFSYSVSHDLRAPLRHVSGYVQLLGDSLGDKLEEEPRRFLRVIGDASRHMGELIDGLLAFSRMARTGLRQTPVDLAETVRDAIAGLETEARGRDIEWRVGPLPTIEGDPTMVRQVYANLLGNAVKYTARRAGARVEVGQAGTEGDRSVLFVRDNGVGFDMKYAGKLFGIFQRLHPVDEFEGTGIGLATVQRIVARHGGRVWAEAVPDAGATFYFTLRQSAQGPLTR